jgi:HK97 family phage prohead protease
MQRRYTCPAQNELRLKVQRRDNQPAAITGYGAVYYREGDPTTEYWLWSDMVERIKAGAFDRAIREDDVRSLFNHDSNIVLGRNKSGTLALSVDAMGLRYEVTPPDTQLIRDQVLAPIDRGDVSGASFMFEPTAIAWVEEKRATGWVLIREVQEVKLWEVGPVVFPAYEGASSGLRAADLAGDQVASWRKQYSKRAADAVRVHSRAIEIQEAEYGGATRS